MVHTRKNKGCAALALGPLLLHFAEEPLVYMLQSSVGSSVESTELGCLHATYSPPSETAKMKNVEIVLKNTGEIKFLH